MLIASGFSWFYLIPGVEDGSLFEFAGQHGQLVAATWLGCACVVLFALLARAGLNAAILRGGAERFYASESLNARTAGEYVVGAFMGVMSSMMDHKYMAKFLPLVVALAVYIFFCNIMGLFPGFLPPTDNINTNLGMAITVVVTYLGVGLYYDPKGLMHHIIGPVWWLAPMFIGLELLTYLAIRPGSLTIRLAANLFGDHQVFTIMSGIIPYPLVYPVPFLVLGLLVCTVQAGVFALLTTVYISMALPHGEHHDAHH